MLDVLKKKMDDDEGKKCDLSKYLTRCTLDNICGKVLPTKEKKFFPPTGSIKVKRKFVF